MKASWSILLVTAVLFGTALAVSAQDAPKDKPSKKTEKKEKFDKIAFTKLRIKHLRTMADLLEEQIAESPNSEKIAELQKELRKIDQEMWKMQPPRRGRNDRGRGGRGRPGGQGRGQDGMGPGGMGPGGDPGMGPGMGPPPDWDDEGDDRGPPPRGRGGNRRNNND